MKKRLAVQSIVRIVLLIGAIGVLSHAAALTGYAAGAKYPAKPILFVVPYAPGGGTDIMVRVIDRVGTQLKVLPQPLVIENKSGGSGVVGKSYAKTRPADGYTITCADDSSTVVDLFGNAPWPYNDFTYIAKLNRDYQMIVVRADSPYKTLKDLVTAAKAQPNSIKIGGTGVSQIDVLHVAMFEKAGGVKFNYIGFDSGGQVITNLLGGHVDMRHRQSRRGVRADARRKGQVARRLLRKTPRFRLLRIQRRSAHGKKPASTSRSPSGVALQDRREWPRSRWTG